MVISYNFKEFQNKVALLCLKKVQFERVTGGVGFSRRFLETHCLFSEMFFSDIFWNDFEKDFNLVPDLARNSKVKLGSY